MNNKTDLAEKIEKLVREVVDAHMQETRAMVVSGVTRALEASAVTAPVKAAHRTVRSARKGRRRGQEEVAQLAEDLHRLVCAQPGEGMVAFATSLGKSARELHRPMANLKRAGRVRSVGERHRTRYFPAFGQKTSASSSAA